MTIIIRLDTWSVPRFKFSFYKKMGGGSVEDHNAKGFYLIIFKYYIELELVDET